MSRRPLRAVLLVLLALFLSFPAFAAPRPETRPREASLSASFRRHVSAIWSYLAVLLKNGSGIDPFGQPAPTSGSGTGTPQGNGDNGSGIDPFGGK